MVQEKLGHSSREITSDTYTSVLPEMMRAEAESVMAVVPRDVPFQVRTPLEIPETAWRNDIALYFAHGARQSGDNWAVGAQSRPDSDLLGMIALASRGQDDAANAAVKWIRDHCAANDLDLVRVENFNHRYPEEQRADFSLTRFTTPAPNPRAWTTGHCRRACRQPGEGALTGPRTGARGGVRAPMSPDPVSCPLCVHWIML